ncbi:MAG: hypothetical protein ACE14V_11275 [bacterium]
MNEQPNLLTCCQRCQYYSSCITKWLRGEKGERDYCCDHCPYFAECNPQYKSNSKSQSSLGGHNAR